MGDIQKQKERPLSPHLQVYRLPYNALMSITGRGVGIVLSLSLLVVLIWFNVIVWNPSFYDQTMTFLDNPLTQYAGLVWAFLIFFYIGNGLRHVAWHIGLGVNEKSGIMTGNIVLVVSALLTLGLWSALNNETAAGITQDGINNSGVEEGGENAE